MLPQTKFLVRLWCHNRDRSIRQVSKKVRLLRPEQLEFGGAAACRPKSYIVHPEIFAAPGPRPKAVRNRRCAHPPSSCCSPLPHQQRRHRHYRPHAHTHSSLHHQHQQHHWCQNHLPVGTAVRAIAVSTTPTPPHRDHRAHRPLLTSSSSSSSSSASPSSSSSSSSSPS